MQSPCNHHAITMQSTRPIRKQSESNPKAIRKCNSSCMIISRHVVIIIMIKSLIIRHSERIKKHSSLISDTQGSSSGTQSECEHIREHSEIASVTLRYHQWAHSELINSWHSELIICDTQSSSGCTQGSSVTLRDHL